MSRPRVVIVGGGLAGLATAWALSDFALDVVVLESRQRCGGRAGSFLDTDSGHEIDYCQHVAMGCCTNFLWWMRQCELIDQFSRFRELTFFAPHAPPARWAPNQRLPAPLHLAATLGKLPFLNRAQRAEVRRGIWRLMRSEPSPANAQTMGDWLRDAGQSSATVEHFWDVILISALGEQAQHVAVAPARKVFVDGFLAAHQAADVWIPKPPLAELFGRQLTDVLRARGVTLECGQMVKRLFHEKTQVAGVETTAGRIGAQQVVLAVPWHGLERLVANTPAAMAIANLSEITELPTSPITGLHLWFDRPITQRRHSVLVGGLAQWLFRPEHPAANSAIGTEHYYQVVVSASRDLRQMEASEATSQILKELQNHFPQTKTANLLRSRIVTDPRSVFSVRPATEAIRPSQQTADRGLHLAGDYTLTGWPATMEGAVISGFLAADGVLRSTGLGSFPPQPPLPMGRLARWLMRPSEQPF